MRPTPFHHIHGLHGPVLDDRKLYYKSALELLKLASADKNESFALYKRIKWEGFDYYANQNKGFGFIDGKKHAIPGDFLNYIPIDAGNFYISQDSISFEFELKGFNSSFDKVGRLFNNSLSKY